MFWMMVFIIHVLCHLCAFVFLYLPRVYSPSPKFLKINRLLEDMCDFFNARFSSTQRHWMKLHHSNECPSFASQPNAGGRYSPVADTW